MFYKVMDAQMSVVQVGNFAGAALNIASTTLRAVIGDIPLDDMLAKRDEINHAAARKLDEVTERWGVKVTNVEIREIIPPAAVQEAMTRQMSAERTRRAVVTEADGRQGGRDHGGRGQQGGRDPQRRGFEAVEHPHGRRRTAGRDPAGRGLRARAPVDQRDRRSIVDLKTMQLQYLETLKSIGVIILVEGRRPDGAVGSGGGDRRDRRGRRAHRRGVEPIGTADRITSRRPVRRAPTTSAPSARRGTSAPSVV